MYLLQCAGKAAECAADHGHQGQAFVGQRQAARQAAKQGLAQLFFQLADVLAHRCLGDVQLQRCPGEVEVAGGGFEGAQCVQR
ncbi:hypothetical protein D3C72_2026800 [compost metagenome]